MLRSIVTAVVFTIAALLVLGELGFNLAPLLASAGIVGVALGFGAQSLVKDLIAGLFMLLEDQYGVGDTVDLGEATGMVEAVGLRITTVRDAPRRALVHPQRRDHPGRQQEPGLGHGGDRHADRLRRLEEATAVLRTAAAAVADGPGARRPSSSSRRRCSASSRSPWTAR